MSGAKSETGCVMTVLVSGGAGYIGSHMVHALADAGEAVVVIDNLSTGFSAFLPEAVPLFIGDAADENLVEGVIAAHDVDAIIHFAGSVVVPDSMRDPLGYYRNNTMTTRNLLNAAVRCGVKRFIFSSTAAVYGNPERMPVTEDAPTRPLSPYGSSKLMSEIMLHDCAAAHALNFVVLRYFNVAGADPQARIGLATLGATHLLKIAVEAATGQRAKIDVFGTDYPTPDGSCVRDFIHVTDLVQAHGAALVLPARRRRLDHAELRLRPRLLGAGDDRSGATGVGTQLRRSIRRTAAGRHHDHDRGHQPHPRHAGLGAAVRRSRHHRCPCAGVGGKTAARTRRGAGGIGLTRCRAAPARVARRGVGRYSYAFQTVKYV